MNPWAHDGKKHIFPLTNCPRYLYCGDDTASKCQQHLLEQQIVCVLRAFSISVFSKWYRGEPARFSANQLLEIPLIISSLCEDANADTTVTLYLQMLTG